MTEQDRRLAEPPGRRGTFEEDELEELVPQSDTSVELAAMHRGASAREAWECLVEQLRMEVRQPAFEKWILPSWLYAWDPSAGIFIVCGSSAYARDWLAERMQSTIAHALTGICGRIVSVRFIGPNDLEEGDET